MDFKTSIEPNLKNVKFGLHTKFLTIGSCFSEVLGNYLNSIKIECLNNPFGVIYNLKSIIYNPFLNPSACKHIGNVQYL